MTITTVATSSSSTLFAAAIKTTTIITPLRCTGSIISRHQHTTRFGTLQSRSNYRRYNSGGSRSLIFLPALLLSPLLLFGRTSSSFAIHYPTSRRWSSNNQRTIMSAATTTYEVNSPSLPDEDRLNFDIYLEFVTNVDKCHKGQEEFDGTLLIGLKNDLEKVLVGDFLSKTLQLPDVSAAVVTTMLESIDDDLKGAATSTYVHKGDNGAAHQLVLCSLPTKLSRNNHPLSPYTITSHVNSHCLKPGKNTRIIMVVPDDSTPIAPLASAITKGFHIFNKKTSAPTTPKKTRKVSIAFVSAATSTIRANDDQLKASQAVSEGTLLTQRLLDMHPELLNTDYYAKEVENIVQILNKDDNKVTMSQIVGEDLKEQGFGGTYNVGKAATCPPRFIILEYTPTTPVEGDTTALVGKGILYDTGGLSLKPKTGMPGMKHDMGGSAGLLAAFYAAVQLNIPKKLYCLLCVAENAIGPTAVRNDDIIRLYSGKTVEVNNADAEGRLVLGDGVAYASCGKHLKGNVDCIIDMATLTGAQLVTTGKKHAAVLCNTKELEDKAVQAGLYAGEFVFPLLYCPELLMDEFKSAVADMKNSVKDRSNAQCSCAAHFIEAHLDANYTGGYIHVDMAGPATNYASERGTGYGASLVLALLKAPGF